MQVYLNKAKTCNEKESSIFWKDRSAFDESIEYIVQEPDGVWSSGN